MPRLVRLIVTFFCVSVCPFAWAHDPGLSSANIAVGTGHFEVVTTFAAGDARWLVPGDSERSLSEVNTEAFRSDLAKSASSLWSLQADGRGLQPSAISVSAVASNNVAVTESFALNSAHSLEFSTTVFQSLPPGHRQHVTISTGPDHLVVAKLLSAADPKVAAVLPTLAVDSSTSVAASADTVKFTDFLKLGIEHILTGYDHLLFLFAFLITAKGFRPILKIITSFTIAHSITLGLSALNIVDVPSRWIEPLIAATIVFVALQNLFKRDRLAERAGLTFAFGLIHGFGFAAVLRDMGIASLGSSAWRALAGFNLGVELGQIAVASIVLPMLWYLRTRPSYERSLMPIASALIAVAGSFWLVQRVTGA